MDIFSTRELATAFWVGAILIAVGMAIVTNKKIRQGFIAVSYTHLTLPTKLEV